MGQNSSPFLGICLWIPQLHELNIPVRLPEAELSLGPQRLPLVPRSRRGRRSTRMLTKAMHISFEQYANVINAGKSHV